MSNAKSPATKPDAEIVVPQRFSTEQLAGVKSFEDAVRLAAQQHDGLVDSLELGDGFRICDDKDKLVGKHFVIMEWEYGKHLQYGLSKFVIVRLVTAQNEKVIITDGSTGIMRQLETMKEVEGRLGGINCQEGLRVSEYGLNDAQEIVEIGAADQTSKGRTFYIA